MSDTRSTADSRPRHRSRRHHRRRDAALDAEESDSGYSTPASDAASRATTTRSSRRGGRKRRTDNALVVREEYHVQRPPRAYQASEYSDGYDEYTVGGDDLDRGGGRQQYREKDRGRDRERGILIIIAAFMVGLIFCLRESRSRR